MGSHIARLGRLPTPVLLITGRDATHVSLSWSLPRPYSKVSEYVVERGTDGTSFPTTVYTGSALTYSDPIAPTSGVRLYYRVRYIDTNGRYSAYSTSQYTVQYAPVFSGAPTAWIVPATGGTKNWATYVSDVDSLDILKFSLSQKFHPNISIDENTGIVTIPSYLAGQNGNITVRATDIYGLWVDAPVCAVNVEAATGIPISLGENWTFPATYPVKSPYGGFYELWGPAARPISTSNGDLLAVGGFWRDLEPTEGVIDTDIFEVDQRSNFYNLAEIKAAGRKAILWVAFGEYNDSTNKFDAPAWYISKYAPASIADPRTGKPWGLAVWQQTAPYWNFISQLGALYGPSGSSLYKDVIDKVYVTTFNAGGEFNIPPDVLPNCVAAGLTTGAGGVLETYAKAMLTNWANAFGVRRCVWEDTQTVDVAEGEGARNATIYAISTAGANVREGAGEVWISSTSARQIRPEVGTNIIPTPFNASVPNYYLSYSSGERWGAYRGTDKFYGDEYENESKMGVPEDSVKVADYLHYKLALLNGLRRGQTHFMLPPPLRNDTNYNWTNLTPLWPLRDYVRQVAGYPAAQSPDAWAILQAWVELGAYGGLRKFHNLERFLIQRDITSNGVTELTDMSDTALQPAAWPNYTGANPRYWGSRTTRRTSGHDYIYFQVDSTFASTLVDGKVQILVYFKDTGTAQWKIQYSTDSIIYKNTSSVSCLNTGLWKTATFTITDIAFRQAQTDNMDFRIYNGGVSDVTIGMVRIIRTTKV